ncbi:STAS domain-containing protein [Streptomyces virginiae]
MCAEHGVAVVAVTGEVDLTTIPFFQDALEDALISRPRHLQVDFAQVTF